MPPLKVLHIDTGRTLRGGQRQLLLLAKALQARGIRQYIATPAGDEIAARLPDIPVLRLSSMSLARKLRVKPLLRLIANERILLVHAHDSEAHTIGLILKWLVPNLILVVTRRVIFPPSGFFSRKLKYNRLVDRYIAVSRAVAGTLTAAGINPLRLEIINDGLDIAEVNTTPADHEAVTSLVGPRKAVIVAAGALTPEKDFETAIKAFAGISRNHSDVAFIVIGDGPLRSRLEAQIADTGLDNIFLTGNQENLTAIFKACDIYLSTSVSEGLGSAAMLAGACGLPLLVSDAGGLPEIVEDNINGIICPAGDTDRFVKALQLLLDDPARRQQMAQQSRLRAAAFDISGVADKTADLYNSLLAPSRSGI